MSVRALMTHLCLLVHLRLFLCLPRSEEAYKLAASLAERGASGILVSLTAEWAGQESAGGLESQNY